MSAVLAVALSTALVNFQWGLVLGIFSTTSVPIDHTDADVWVGSAGVTSVDTGHSVSDAFSHVALQVKNQPGVTACSPYVIAQGVWVKPDSSRVYCSIIGSEFYGAPGMVRELSATLQNRLTEQGTVVVDESTLDDLGRTAEVNGQPVRVVGVVKNCTGMNIPYVLCSLATARQLTGQNTTYLVLRCSNAQEAAQNLRRHYPGLSVFTASEFSYRTRLYWLTKTNGGMATLLIALVSLIVGSVITAQSLFAATTASIREYTLLVALGIPRRRIGRFIMAQAGGVGVLGILLAIPITVLIRGVGMLVGLPFLFPWPLALSVLTISCLMALVAGLLTLRTLGMMQPSDYLR